MHRLRSTTPASNCNISLVAMTCDVTILSHSIQLNLKHQSKWRHPYLPVVPIRYTGSSQMASSNLRCHVVPKPRAYTNQTICFLSTKFKLGPFYLVNWRGHTSETWEPVEFLAGYVSQFITRISKIQQYGYWCDTSRRTLVCVLKVASPVSWSSLCNSVKLVLRATDFDACYRLVAK